MSQDPIYEFKEDNNFQSQPSAVEQKRQKELGDAVRALNSEVIPTLLSGEFRLQGETGPVYTQDRQRRQIVPSDQSDQDFMSGENIVDKDGNAFTVNAAHSIYHRFELRENISLKSFVIQHRTFNSAYFPTNSGFKDKNEIKKGHEIRRGDDFRRRERNSAFDIEYARFGEAVKESLSIVYNGIEYVFKKIEDSNGKDYVELGIVKKADRTKGIVETILVSPQKQNNMTPRDFDALRDVVEKALNKASGNVAKS